MTQAIYDPITQIEQQRRRIIVLRRGETRTVRCGRRIRTRRFTIRPGEVLVVICRVTRRTFIFVCRDDRRRRRRRRVIVRTVPFNTRISVTCI
ncbi:hypothetical protein [Thermoflavimicrobium dichotomicum]|uniref:hypothetical protein n=1 Tax=Thermoflavimicrobium dichotomicum TaxID=46223 RepID=UPI001113582C|nr:hypothetical protein [Thermoflavimicrobium dichotomicum]